MRGIFKKFVPKNPAREDEEMASTREYEREQAKKEEAERMERAVASLSEKLKTIKSYFEAAGELPLPSGIPSDKVGRMLNALGAPMWVTATVTVTRREEQRVLRLTADADYFRTHSFVETALPKLIDEVDNFSVEKLVITLTGYLRGAEEVEALRQKLQKLEEDYNRDYRRSAMFLPPWCR